MRKQLNAKWIYCEMFSHDGLVLFTNIQTVKKKKQALMPVSMYHFIRKVRYT